MQLHYYITITISHFIIVQALRNSKPVLIPQLFYIPYSQSLAVPPPPHKTVCVISIMHAESTVIAGNQAILSLQTLCFHFAKLHYALLI